MARWLLLLFALAWSFSCCDSSSAQQPSATPVHPFMKGVYDQIGRVWYWSVQKNADKLAVGTVRVVLTASPDGRITSLRVISNTSNRAFAEICLSAIREAKIPAIPAEFLHHGKFQDEMSFKMFAN